MFNQDPASIYATSSGAVRDYKRNQQINYLVYALLAVIAVLGTWTILNTSGAMGKEIPDLADIGSIREHIVARLVTILAVVTLALYLFKEWRYGDFGFTMMFFLVPLLGVWLFPVVASELEPDAVDLSLDFQVVYCDTNAFENGVVVNQESCAIAETTEYTALMSDAEPTRDDALIREADTTANDANRWNVVGRGKFHVYFMLQQGSMEECETSLIVNGRDPSAPYDFACLERDGSVWSVHQFETSEEQTRQLTIFQERP